MIENVDIPEISHNNSHIWGYNGVPFSFRDSKTDKYFTDYAKLSRNPLGFREECLETAKLIRDKYPTEKLRLFLSGGLDSHLVAECFRILKIPFTAVTVILGDGWNNHDVKYAHEYCEQNNIPQIRLHCDIEKIWDSGEYWDIVKDIQAETPQYCGNLWAADQVDGYLIFGLGEPDLRKKNGIAYDVEQERYRIYDRYMVHRKRVGAPSFFKYTTEIKASGYFTKEVMEWVYDQNSPNLLKEIKNNFYPRYFSQLKPRPEVKGIYGTLSDYSGYEFVPKEAMPAQNKARAVLEKEFCIYDKSNIILIDYFSRMEKLLEGYEVLRYFQLRRRIYEN